MKNTKTEQLIWLIVATVFTNGMIVFINDTGTLSALAATFTGVVGIFIGLDIAVMIKKTSEMSGGAFKHMNKHRYIAAIVIFGILLVESFIVSGLTGRNYDSLYASFGMGLLIVIGGLISGIEGNKMATRKIGNEPEPNA